MKTGGSSTLIGMGPDKDSRRTGGEDGEVDIGETLQRGNIVAIPPRMRSGLPETLGGEEKPPPIAESGSQELKESFLL